MFTCYLIVYYMLQLVSHFDQVIITYVCNTFCNTFCSALYICRSYYWKAKNFKCYLVYPDFVFLNKEWFCLVILISQAEEMLREKRKERESARRIRLQELEKRQREVF